MPLVKRFIPSFFDIEMVPSGTGFHRFVERRLHLKNEVKECLGGV
jgi:hypothetical protein